MQLEDTKRKAQEEKIRQKEARASLQNRNRNMEVLDNGISLNELVKSASERNAAFEASISSSANNNGFQGYEISADGAITGRKDNSGKAYYREFKKVVELADVILQVLDARDPLGCRAKQIEELIMNSGANKRIILILNKIDLVPREVVEQWLKYLRNEFPTVAFKASTQSQRSHLGQSTISTSHASTGLLSSGECLGRLMIFFYFYYFIIATKVRSC